MGMDNEGHFQLRRVGPPATCPNVKDIMILPVGVTKFGRAASNTFYLDSLTLKNFISRNHAEIHGIKNENGQLEYVLYDKGLNGTFINDIKMQKTAVLEEGDKITFGHTNGYKLSAGEYSQQPNSEFQFVFERAPSSRRDIKEEEDWYNDSNHITNDSSTPQGVNTQKLMYDSVSNSRTNNKPLKKSNSSSSLSSSCSSSSSSSSASSSSSSSSSSDSSASNASNKYSRARSSPPEDKNSDYEVTMTADDKVDEEEEERDSDKNDQEVPMTTEDKNDVENDEDDDEDDSANENNKDNVEDSNDEEHCTSSENPSSPEETNVSAKSLSSKVQRSKQTRKEDMESESETQDSPSVPNFNKKTRSKLRLPKLTKKAVVNSYSDDDDLPSLNGNQKEGTFTSEDKVEMSRDPYVFTSGQESTSDDETDTRLKAVLNSINKIASPKGTVKRKGRTKGRAKTKQKKALPKQVDEDIKEVKKPKTRKNQGRKRKAPTKPNINTKAKKGKTQKPRQQRKRNTKHSDEDDDDGYEEDLEEGVVWYNKETCESSSCKRPSSKKVQWVQCDYCDKWYHTVCMNCKYEHVNDPDIKFSCGCT